MDLDILGLLSYCIPALITGVMAFLFFREHTENEANRRNFLIKRDLKKDSLPMRLQAYERLSLYLERIKPSKALIRITPTSSNKEDYEALLIANIEQEFDHNLAQQIYVTDDCWSISTTAKNATIQIIRKATQSQDVTTANELREFILKNMIGKRTPSDAALSFIKEEVSQIW
jgi:hypothetical protein